MKKLSDFKPIPNQSEFSYFEGLLFNIWLAVFFKIPDNSIGTNCVYDRSESRKKLAIIMCVNMTMRVYNNKKG